MKAFLFHRDYSILPPRDVAASVKVAYLLAESLSVSDSIIRSIRLHDALKIFPLKHKIKLLENLYRNSDHKEELMEVLEKIRKGVHSFNTAKNKTADLIVAFKRVERHLNILFEDGREHIEKVTKDHGFREMSPLLGVPFFTETFITDEDAPIKGVDGYRNTAANILLENFACINDEPCLFVLPRQFIDPETRSQQRFFDAYEPEALDKKLGYLQFCAQLPDVNFFKGLELVSLRKDLEVIGIVFREKIEEWIRLCSETDNAETRVSFFIKEIMPAAGDMQTPIVENRLVQYQTLAQDASRMVTDVYVGEVPVSYLWKFFYEYKAINEESMNLLKAANEINCRDDIRWPVILTVNSFIDEAWEKWDSGTDEINPDNLPRKKSISLD